MAGRGMGAATRGGGSCAAGKKPRMLSKPSSKVEVVMASKGGAINQHKRMAMKGVKKFRKGGSCG